MTKSMLMAYLFRVAINQGAMLGICNFRNGFKWAFNVPFINGFRWALSMPFRNGFRWAFNMPFRNGFR
jgi:hypothetical protein